MRAINHPTYDVLALKVYLFFILGRVAAVDVGTKVSFGCKPEWVFSHNWYQNPKISITCQPNGLFDFDGNWPLCIDRKKYFKIHNSIRNYTYFSL